MTDFMEKASGFIIENGFKSIRLSSIEKDGSEETFDFRLANPCQNTYSVAKTFASAAAGILYDRGLLTPDEKICDILREFVPCGIDERWEKATVRHALTHSAGLPGGFLDIDCNPYHSFGEDYLGFTFRTPLLYTPGEDSKYSDGAFYLISRIVTAKTNEKLDDFLRRELFIPLGIGEVAFSKCPYGYPMGATGMYMHSRDMAKLGYLYLNGGIVNGRRILSEEWIKLTFSEDFALGANGDGTIYFKGGMCGQKLYIDFKSGRSVALMSDGADTDKFLDFIERYDRGQI